MAEPLPASADSGSIMPRATSTRSTRTERPAKELRRSTVDDDTAARVTTAGASGETRSGPRRPGRAASLRSISSRNRSQKWRSPKVGQRTRRKGNLAKGSRTGRNRTAQA